VLFPKILYEDIRLLLKMIFDNFFDEPWLFDEPRLLSRGSSKQVAKRL
jgi:hypothetical protein